MLRGIGEAIVGFMIMIAIVAFLAGGFMVWFIPILWTWIKPIIHTFTA